jgi:hypothetical protein
MSNSPTSEVTPEFRAASDEVAAVVEAEAVLGMHDNGEGSALEAILRIPA